MLASFFDSSKGELLDKIDWQDFQKSRDRIFVVCDFFFHCKNYKFNLFASEMKETVTAMNVINFAAVNGPEVTPM